MEEVGQGSFIPESPLDLYSNYVLSSFPIDHLIGLSYLQVPFLSSGGVSVKAYKKQKPKNLPVGPILQ